jgi:hypothetical protein
MKFQTVYSIENHLNLYLVIKLLLVIALTLSLAFFVYKRFKILGHTCLDGVARAGFFAAIAFATVGVVFIFGVSDFFVVKHLIKLLDAGDYQRVEGQVAHFKPMPSGGHGYESFCVQNSCFHYAENHFTGGFNTPASHGGPIRMNGANVRISYVGNIILRIEVVN